MRDSFLLFAKRGAETELPISMLEGMCRVALEERTKPANLE